MKLYRVVVQVSNIEQATLFYSRVLEQVGRRVSRGRHYFDCEGTILACCDPRADGDPFDAEPNPEYLYFAVDDLEKAYETAFAAGARSPKEDDWHTGPLGRIATRPWGERSFYVVDPFGNKLCFVERRTVFVGA